MKHPLKTEMNRLWSFQQSLDFYFSVLMTIFIFREAYIQVRLVGHSFVCFYARCTVPCRPYSILLWLFN